MGKPVFVPAAPDYSGKSVEDVAEEFPKGTPVKVVKGQHKGNVGVVTDVYGGGKSGNVPTLTVDLTHLKRRNELIPRHPNYYEEIATKPANVEQLEGDELDDNFDKNGNPI